MKNFLHETYISGAAPSARGTRLLFHGFRRSTGPLKILKDRGVDNV